MNDKLPNVEVIGTCFVVEDTIYLTANGLRRGVGDLASTMLEEYHHYKYKYPDFTREYQDFLLRLIVNLYAEQTNTII